MSINYKPRKSLRIPVHINEPIEFLCLDWYDADLPIETDRKDCYLNQYHNKVYTIFIFGVNSQGNSVCLKVNNYTPYFYIQIPDDFNDRQTQDFVDWFDSNNIEDYDDEAIVEYEEAITSKDYKYTESFKQKSRYYRDSIVSPIPDKKTNNYETTKEDKKDLKTHITEKVIFWTFMNGQKFKFLKLAFKSKQGHRFFERMFKVPQKLNISGKTNSHIKYNLFESDLEPVLRFLHDTKIKPSNWLTVPASKYINEIRQSKTQINISCDWINIIPLEKTEIPPLLIASFDIEADSSHGDFPIPKKDCKKLSNQLAVAWIRNVKII